MKKNTLLLLILCLSYIIITEIPIYILNTNELIYNSLLEKLGREQVNDVINLQEKWKWVGYLLIPIYLFFKCLIISSVLYTGIFLFNKEMEFKRILNLTLNAEFIFLLIPIFKIIWFYFFQVNYTLEDIQYFYPLSALNIIGYKGLEPWLIYPLQTLNLFELAYIIYLAYQIGIITKTNADTGLKIVAFSYVPALLLWVTVVMFFTLNYS